MESKHRCIPLQTALARRRSIVDLGQVRHHGALVRVRDRVVRVTGELGTADDMLPVRADPVTGLDVDDSLRLGTALAAHHVRARDILHRVVIVRGAEAGELALVLAVDGDLLEDGVRRGAVGQESHKRELHDDSSLVSGFDSKKGDLG